MPEEIRLHRIPLTGTFTGQSWGGRRHRENRGIYSNTGFEIPVERRGAEVNDNLYFDGPDPIAETYANHSSGQRTNTDVVIATKLRSIYTNLGLTIVQLGSTDILAYAVAGNAKIILREDPEAALGLSHRWRQYTPPVKRLDKTSGTITDKVIFGKFIIRWTPPTGNRSEEEFILYIVNGRDGGEDTAEIINQYILAAPEKQTIVNELLTACGLWQQELRGEIWSFDAGSWHKSTGLWESIQNATWDDVILDDTTKTSIRSDIEGFFNAQATYNKLKVPWKRGVIFHGPPGNGKTISIKAILNNLQSRNDPTISTLYVRSAKGPFGSQHSISVIFTLARRQAPCILIFEDLDSIVTDKLRSYFLNEVDGLQSNNGILMLGSTNHLDRLDPAISKRPSRFDRKYLFSDPDMAQREEYCRYWQKKVGGGSGGDDGGEMEVGDEFCKKVAGITEGLSFAYIQEAFVASLLAIARRGEGDNGDGLAGARVGALWEEMQKEVEMLREGLENEELKAEEAKAKKELKNQLKQELKAEGEGRAGRAGRAPVHMHMHLPPPS